MRSVFVSPDWVAENRDRVTVVDVRDPFEYESGHVPGAVNVPFREFRDPGDDAPGKLPTAADFGRLFGDAGIAPDDTVLAYDDTSGVYAARFLLTAAVFGHDGVGLLDGGYAAWREVGESVTAAPSPDPRAYNCERDANGPLATAADLDAALDAEAAIVDTRAPVEYDTVHLPDAVNVQWRAFLGDDGRLASRARCRSVLAEDGVTPDRPVYLYCNTARRLSFVYAVLRELGYDDVFVYEGGIDSWAAYGGPVETTVSDAS